MVHIPTKIPLLRILTIVLGIGTFIWIALEGDLTNVLLMGIGAVVVVCGHVWQRLFGGRALRLWQFLGVMVATGLSAGLLANVAVLTLMAVKTGLHGHGPEFTDGEIRWVVAQMPLWLFIGTLLGLGTGLVVGSAAKPVKR